MILRRAVDIEEGDNIQFEEGDYPSSVVVRVVRDMSCTKLYIKQNSSVLPYIKLRNADYIEVTHIPRSYDKE
jgi:hypothetical protein